VRKKSGFFSRKVVAFIVVVLIVVVVVAAYQLVSEVVQVGIVVQRGLFSLRVSGT
jgi:hypothetical protein